MDTKEYNEVVGSHSDALFRYALRHLRDRDTAKDIVQACFMRLWMHLDRVDGAKVRAFLFKVAHNTIIDHIRRHKHSTHYGSCHVLTTTQPETRLRDTLEQGFAQLSPQQRSLVLLRDHEGFSYAEMASMTGLSMEQVKVYLFRARSAMKHALVEPGQVA